MVVGDKIRLVKPFGVLDNVGEVYDVAAIFKAGEIYFEYGNGYTGVMSYDEFEKYFELVPVEKTENKVEKKKHEWTNWQLTDSSFYNPVTDIFEGIGLEWRTDNEKRVQVRMKNNPQLRSRSSCYKKDKFTVDDGYFLAKHRLYIKWVSKVVDDYAKSL